MFLMYVWSSWLTSNRSWPGVFLYSLKNYVLIKNWKAVSELKKGCLSDFLLVCFLFCPPLKWYTIWTSLFLCDLKRKVFIFLPTCRCSILVAFSYVVATWKMNSQRRNCNVWINVPNLGSKWNWWMVCSNLYVELHGEECSAAVITPYGWGHGLEVRWPMFESWLYHWPTLWPWAGEVISMYLGFLSIKWGGNNCVRGFCCPDSHISPLILAMSAEGHCWLHLLTSLRAIKA